MSKMHFIEPEKYMAVRFPRLTKEERAKIMKKQYAILLQRLVINDSKGNIHVSNTWYYSAGKYSNTFSTSSHLNGARIFPTVEKAQEVLNSEKFQCRLKAANALSKRIGFDIYKPTVVEIGVIND